MGWLAVTAELRLPALANEKRRGLRPRLEIQQTGLQAVGAIGGVFKMSNKLGIGGLRVRNSPNCILLASV